MHEMSLAENIVQLVEESAEAQGFSHARTIWLEIGALACVEVEALNFCFDIVAKGSKSENAQLEFSVVPGRGWCESCQGAVELFDRVAVCPHCAGHQVKVTGGTEMRIKELDVV